MYKGSKTFSVSGLVAFDNACRARGTAGIDPRRWAIVFD